MVAVAKLLPRPGVPYVIFTLLSILFSYRPLSSLLLAACGEREGEAYRESRRVE